MKVILGVMLLSVVVHGLDQLIRDVETRLKPGELIATIPQLSTSYKISFDLKPNSYSYGFHSVLHFTMGEDLTQYGDRTPAVWLLAYEPNYKGFHIAAPISGNPNRYTDLERPPVNVWTNIVISQQLVQNKYVFTVQQNETNIFSEENNQPKKFDNVKVFASDPWYPTQDGSIKNLTLENGLAGETLPNAVLAPKYYVDNDNEEVLKRNNLITVISTLEKAFDIYFDLKITKYTAGFTNIIHLTTGENNAQYGDRTPAIFLVDGNLHVGSAINGQKNYDFTSEQKFPLGVWVNIHIRQIGDKGNFDFIVKVDQKIVFNVKNSKPETFKNVKVYAADPWYEAAEGSIKNFKVINGYVAGKKSLKKDAIRKKILSSSYHRN